MNPDIALPTRHLSAGAAIAQVRPSQNEPVTLASPAINVMTDLTTVKAATTTPFATLQQAEQAMIHQGVRLLFVVEELPVIVGLITATDLHGDKPMRVAEARRVNRDDLSVAELMTPLADLDAIDLTSVQHAAVSNLVETLMRFGRQHLLVVDDLAPGKDRIRGVVSRTQIERQLGQPLDVPEVATNFAELGQMLS